ncbi:hypothetical protein HY68_36210 [Streptomyces sp. AcH 505]|nr:hypothetical protein HY68_36210 [Streptomyces sp. AcH 505]
MSRGWSVRHGAYEELAHSGELGGQTLELLRRLGRQVTRTSSFPPPQVHGHWSDDAVDDLLTDMLSRQGAGQRFFMTCFFKAVDEASLERLFLTSIRNFLIDQAKMTDRGKLRRRFSARLAADDRFWKVPGPSPRWTLTSRPDGAVWQGGLDELVEVAWRVRGVGITRWNHSGPTPAGTVHALMTVLTAILEHAEGSVREEDLARALEARFELLAPAQFVALHTDDGTLRDPTTSAQIPPGTVPGESEAQAGEIWSSLSRDERILLPYLGQRPDEAALLLGTGPVQATAVLEGLRERLRLALSDDDQQIAVMGALLRRCEDPPPAPVE